MAVAHFFTKSGTSLGSVTDGAGVTAGTCDYIGGGMIVMANGTTTINIAQLSPKLFSFVKSFTVTRTAFGVAVQKNNQRGEDPSKYGDNKIYILTNVQEAS